MLFLISINDNKERKSKPEAIAVWWFTFMVYFNLFLPSTGHFHDTWGDCLTIKSVLWSTYFAPRELAVIQKIKELCIRLSNPTKKTRKTSITNVISNTWRSPRLRILTKKAQVWLNSFHEGLTASLNYLPGSSYKPKPGCRELQVSDGLTMHTHLPQAKFVRSNWSLVPSSALAKLVFSDEDTVRSCNTWWAALGAYWNKVHKRLNRNMKTED